MSQSLDEYIQATQLRWAQEDTTAAIRELHQPTPTPIYTPNPQVIYVDDMAMYVSAPPQTDWIPTLLASLVLVIVLFIVWKVHNK